jgi:hypothetical protein
MTAKKWHDTKNLNPEVVFISSTKAHLVAREATRVRADGSPIEVVSAFYALTRTSSGWKFFPLSDITDPSDQPTCYRCRHAPRAINGTNCRNLGEP